ncbi:site-2 protease family protein [soil metagenome]
MIDTLFSNPLLFVLSAISIVIAITVHEFAHAKTADHLGDPTPGLQGRLTLNPLAHMDIYGTLFLLMFGFGWGKPVQFDPFNLKNPRKDAAIISVAGPLSNFIMAIICSILLRLLVFFNMGVFSIIGTLFLSTFVAMNLILGVFNLIPIHPLDGFKIVGGLLSEKQSKEWYGLQRYGMIFLLLLIFPFSGGSMLHKILDPILRLLYSVFIP